MHGEFQRAVRLVWRNAGAFALLCLVLPFPARVVGMLVPGGVFVDMLAQIIFPAAILFVAASAHAGRASGVADAIALSLRRSWKLALASLFSASIVFLGLIVFVVPGVLFALRFALVNCAIALGDAGPVDALKRSDTLTAGRRWDIFFAFAVIMGTASIVSVKPTFELLARAGAPFLGLPPEVVLLATGAYVTGLVAEILMAATLFFFYVDAVAREAPPAATAPGPTS
ncbi:MAG: hypothetical protein HY897_21100 [Deltaproteobacteria bacterium]|nr:hypothetical protein [Deltaproteobacteria bacterium]